jgi:hypothetical protein
MSPAFTRASFAPGTHQERKLHTLRARIKNESFMRIMRIMRIERIRRIVRTGATDCPPRPQNHCFWVRIDVLSRQMERSA